MDLGAKSYGKNEHFYQIDLEITWAVLRLKVQSLEGMLAALVRKFDLNFQI
jgi:hypothetical protein